MYISIIIPTLNRKQKLSRCINAILNNTFQSYRITAIEDINRTGVFAVQNKALTINDQDAYLCLCDDVEIYPDCLQQLVDCMTSNFSDMDGVVGIKQNPCDHPITRFGQVMIGHKFLSRFPPGQVYCPDYVSFYGDSELGLYAESIGKYKFCEAAQLTHYHPTWYPKEKDATHDYGRQEGRGELDKKIWAIRQRKGLLWGKSFEKVNLR